jgi:DNA-directed RNA polymerase I, II, and III subunit RPABC2
MEEENDFESDSIISENEDESEYDLDLDVEDPMAPELEIDQEEVLSKDNEINSNINEEEYDIDSYKDEDDDEMDDEDEINSTKKLHLFNKEVNMDYIKSSHPECLPINMDELNVMLPVIRNEDGIIIDDFHTTIPILTKYEKTRILGQRASMIEHGAKPFIDVPSHIIDSAIIAEMELNEKKIPFIIKRPLPNNGFEYWRLSDLELI